MNYRKEIWMKERGKDCYCPIDQESGHLMVGLVMITKEAPGAVIGEFWYDSGDYKFKIYGTA